MLGLGSLALIQQEFREALRYGRRARELLPESALPYGVVGDTLIELGRYEQAFRAFERMVSIKPASRHTPALRTRESSPGTPVGASSAMRLTLDPAAGQPEPTACAHVELAKLELGLGRAEASGVTHVRH